MIEKINYFLDFLKDKIICLFDDHGKKIIYSSMAVLLFGMIAGPLYGAIEAAAWNV